MWSKNRHVAGLLFFVIVGFELLYFIAGGSVTWATPNEGGTVPTPPRPSGSPTPGSNPPGLGGSSPDTGSNPPGGFPVTCPVGGGGLYCTSNVGDLTLYFPIRSVPLGSLVTIAPATNCPFPTVPPSYAYLGPCYNLTVVGPDGNPITVFNPPLKLWVVYTNEDVAKADGDPNRLAILFYDPVSSSWITGDSTDKTVDPVKQQVSVTIPHLTTYALFFQTGAATHNSNINTWFSSFLEYLRGLTSSSGGN